MSFFMNPNIPVQQPRKRLLPSFTLYAAIGALLTGCVHETYVNLPARFQLGAPDAVLATGLTVDGKHYTVEAIQEPYAWGRFLEKGRARLFTEMAKRSKRKDDYTSHDLPTVAGSYWSVWRFYEEGKPTGPWFFFPLVPASVPRTGLTYAVWVEDNELIVERYITTMFLRPQEEFFQTPFRKTNPPDGERIPFPILKAMISAAGPSQGEGR